MKYYFYHTDLRQNAAFPNFAIQIALIQIIQDDRSTLGLRKSHIRPAGSHLCSASCSECLNEHK